MPATVAEPAGYELFFHDHAWDKREIREDKNSLGAFDEIPIVDLTRLFSPVFEDRMALALEVAEICRTVGFLYVKNHGVDQALVDDMFAASQAYHAQSLDQKMRENVFKSEKLRGYDVHYTETPEGKAGMSSILPGETSLNNITAVMCNVC